MKVNNQKALVAVAIGAIVSVPLQYLARELGAYLMSCCLTDEGGPAIGYNVIYVVSAVAALIPGFITGWFARQRGMLFGFLAGSVGSIMFSSLPTLVTSLWHAGDARTSLDLLSAIFFSAVASGLYAGAAGGSAELLRSGVAIAPTDEVVPVRFGLLAVGLVGIVLTWIVWWIFEAIFPPSYSEMSAGHSIGTFFLLGAANLVFISVALTGFVIMLRSYFQR